MTDEDITIEQKYAKKIWDVGDSMMHWRSMPSATIIAEILGEMSAELRSNHEAMADQPNTVHLGEAELDDIKAHQFTQGYAAGNKDAKEVVANGLAVAATALAKMASDVSSMQPSGQQELPWPPYARNTTNGKADGHAAWYDEPSQQLRIQMNDTRIPERVETVALSGDGSARSARGYTKRLHQLLDDTLLSHGLIRVEEEWKPNGRGFNRGWHCTVTEVPRRPDGAIAKRGQEAGYADPAVDMEQLGDRVAQALAEEDSTAEQTVAQGRDRGTSVQGATDLGSVDRTHAQQAATQHFNSERTGYPWD